MIWDSFFYYGLDTLEKENEAELLELVVQPKKTMSYYRDFGVDHKENYPQSGINQILFPFSVASAIAARNMEVSDGSSGVDRRIAASQQYIIVTDNQNGERDCMVNYFNYATYQNPKITTILLV